MKSGHCALSSSKRKMRILNPVIEVLSHLLSFNISQFAHRGRVGTQPVSDDDLRLAMAFQRLLEELQSRRFVSLFRDIAFQDLAFVIDCAPDNGMDGSPAREHFWCPAEKEMSDDH